MRSKLQRLEALRGFAALYVFVGHLLLERAVEKSSVAGFFLRFGQEAVILFFIISGFVIYYSTVKHGDASFTTYLWRRLRRIYPIFVLALLLSFACAALSSARLPPLDIAQLIGNLLMFQDFQYGKPGVWVAPFCGNTPLWSLSYEWWFYMMFFPISRGVPPRLQLHLVAALSFLGFLTFTLRPNQISLFLLYFFLWWSGVEVARNYLARIPPTFYAQRKTLFYLAGLTVCVGMPLLWPRGRHEAFNLGLHPVLEFRHFGAGLLLLTIGLLWARLRWVGFKTIFGVFAVASPVSYAIYVFHYPIAVTSAFLSSVSSIGLQIAGYAIITVLLAYWAEHPFQGLINRLFPITGAAQQGALAHRPASASLRQADD